MDLTLTVERDGDDDVIAVAGELDVSTGPQLRQAILDVAGEGPVSLVLDLGGVEFIDSTGLGVLVGALRRAREHNGRLSLRQVRPNVGKVFALTGLDQVFDLDPPPATR